MASSDKRKISDEKKELLRQCIIEFFAACEYQQVRVSDICQAAGITPKTLYKHFGSKEQILARAIAPDMHALNDKFATIAALQQNAETTLSQLSLSYFGFYLQRVSVAKVVFLSIPSAKFVAQPEYIQRKQLSLVAQVIRQGVAAKEVRDDVPVALLVEALAAISMRIMYRVLTQKKALPKASTLAQQMDNLVKPLLLKSHG